MEIQRRPVYIRNNTACACVHMQSREQLSKSRTVLRLYKRDGHAQFIPDPWGAYPLTLGWGASVMGLQPRREPQPGPSWAPRLGT